MTATPKPDFQLRGDLSDSDEEMPPKPSAKKLPQKFIPTADTGIKQPIRPVSPSGPPTGPRKRPAPDPASSVEKRTRSHDPPGGWDSCWLVRGQLRSS